LRPGVIEDQDVLSGQVEILWDKRGLVRGQYPGTGRSRGCYQPR